MENVFKFFVLRPPERPTGTSLLIDLRTGSSHQRALEEILERDPTEREVREAVRDFVERSDVFVASVSTLRHGTRAAACHDSVRTAEGVDRVGLEALVERAFGSSLTDVVGDDGFADDRRRLKDTVVTLGLVPKGHYALVGSLQELLYVYELLSYIVTNDGVELDDGFINRWFRVPLVLPEGLVRRPGASSGRPADGDKEKPGDRFRKTLASARRIESSIDELLRVPVSQLTRREREVPGRPTRSERKGAGGQASETEVITELCLAADNLARLSEPTRSVLAEHGLDTQERTYEETVFALRAIYDTFVGEMAHSRVEQAKAVVGFIGGLPVVTTIMRFDSSEREVAGLAALGDMFESMDARRNIESVGIGELLVLRQQIERYEGGEVAHIENVMPGEERKREHRRLHRSEHELTKEAEIATEDEKSLESTERFELQKEAEETIKKELGIEAGVKVSAKFGSAVELESNFDVSYERSTETSKRVASTYAKEVVDKSVQRLSEKIKEKEVVKVVREIEEKNTHGFEGGDEPVSGIYQWVNKKYNMQVYNYGWREFYDVIVPEPGALLWKVFVERHGDYGIEIPPEFNKKPEHITGTSYLELANRYKAHDVEPLPDEIIRIAKTFHSTTHGDTGEEASAPPVSRADSYTVDIPQGYYAYSVKVVIDWAHHGEWENDWAVVSVGAEKHTFRLGIETVKTFLLSDRVGTLPVTFVGMHTYAYAIGIEVMCKRSSKAVEQWRIDTHAALYNGYLRQKSEAEEKIKAAQTSEGVAIQGRNPEKNRRIEMTELKRLCISMFTEQDLRGFDAIEGDETAIPVIDHEEIANHGDFIRFFEHAFEWENLVFSLYPYFWGRDEMWSERMSNVDTDTKFEEFLAAGAARVVIPARRGFEDAITYYLATGRIYQGEGTPRITDPMYVPIINERLERLAEPDEDTKFGSPFPATVPTSLVRLRPDGRLPEWREVEDGRWEEVP